MFPLKFLRDIADNSRRDSLANRLRRKRFAVFRRLLDQVPRPLRILDIGGTIRFWQHMECANEPGLEISILNLQLSELGEDFQNGPPQGFRLIQGDAREMPYFQNKEFDIVFSNSVLEHVGSYADQQRMMDEVKRVGKRYFVQTPNYYFPIEPHFHVPGFQFLPFAIRVMLLRNFDLGWTPKVPDLEQAQQVVASVRLLSRRELQALCPEARIYTERVLGIPKSFILIAE